MGRAPPRGPRRRGAMSYPIASFHGTRRLALALICVVAGGCVHHGVARERPFSDSAGKQVALLVPCELWDVSGGRDWFEASGWYRHQVLVDSQWRRPQHGRLLATLAAGTPVYVERV